MNLIENFKSARRVGTPLMAISSFDPEATMAALQSGMNGANVPIVQWDLIRGWRARNPAGEQAINIATSGDHSLEETISPIEQTVMANDLPENTVLFMINAHRQLDKIEFVQALSNLRDPFASSQRTAVMLGPYFTFPEELQQDVLQIEEPLPSPEELRRIVIDQINAFTEATEIPLTITSDIIDKAVDALRGLAEFPAEQAVAMSISKHGLNLSSLWDRKRQLIRHTEGLDVWMGDEAFSAIGGIQEAKSRARRVINGRKPIKCVVWVDEVEKASAGQVGDTSGTSQDQQAVLLSEIQDKDYNGILAVGVPGGCKSQFAKALGNEAGVPTIRLDLGAMKGSLVGESERRIRHAMKVIEAVAGKSGAFFVLTSNDIRIVRPEMKRRLRKGIWFFDLLTAQERDAVWEIFLTKFPEVDRNGRALVDDTDWTGAEIETCVTTAWEERITLAEAAATIIPVAVSGKDDIERLRREADGKYSSASYPGAYRMPAKLKADVSKASRKFSKGAGLN
jgi:hypothetical protein